MVRVGGRWVSGRPINESLVGGWWVSGGPVGDSTVGGSVENLLVVGGLSVVSGFVILTSVCFMFGWLLLSF